MQQPTQFLLQLFLLFSGVPSVLEPQEEALLLVLPRVQSKGYEQSCPLELPWCSCSTLWWLDHDRHVGSLGTAQ